MSQWSLGYNVGTLTKNCPATAGGLGGWPRGAETWVCLHSTHNADPLTVIPLSPWMSLCAGTIMVLVLW